MWRRSASAREGYVAARRATTRRRLYAVSASLTSVEFLLQMPCVVTLTTGVFHIIPSSVFTSSCMQSAGLSRHLCRLLMHLNICLQFVRVSSPRFKEVTPSSEYKYLVFKYFVLSVDVDDLLLSCTRL